MPNGANAINSSHPPQPTSPAPHDPPPPLAGKTQDLYASLLLLGQGKKANDVLECGNAFYAIYCHQCFHESRIYSSCHLRLCSRCSLRLAGLFVARHWTALQKMTQPKLLTLTFQSVYKLTPATITNCSKALGKLRHQKLWKHNVTGGVAGLELTHGPPGWHPHYHLLIDANYIPRSLLIKAWKAITGGAWHVDIRQIRPEDGVHEVAKYVAKGWTFYTKPHLLAQFLQSTHKRRFLSAFGALYRAGTDPIPTLEIPINLDVKEPVESDDYGFSFMKRCHSCGSRHVESLGKQLDHPITRPAVQIPF